MRSRKGTDTITKIGMFVYGETGTGKSTTALNFAYLKREDGKPMRILYIDMESGSIEYYLQDLKEDGIDTDNIYICYTQSLAETNLLIEKVKNNEDFYYYDDEGYETDQIVLDADNEPFRADVIVVDGTSVGYMTTQQGLLEFSKKRNRVKADRNNLQGEERQVAIEGASLEIKDHGTIKFKGQNLVLNLMATNVHFIVTAREKAETETVKSKDGQFHTVATGRKIPDGFKGLDYNANVSWRLFLNEDDQVCAEIIKDRTKLHYKGEVVVDPSLLEFQKIIDANKGKSEFVIKNDLNFAVETEEKLYTQEIMAPSSKDTNVQKEQEQAKSSNEENKVDLQTLRREINATIRSMTTAQKQETKEKLASANLPVQFSKITDEEVLLKIKDIVMG